MLDVDLLTKHINQLLDEEEKKFDVPILFYLLEKGENTAVSNYQKIGEKKMITRDAWKESMWINGEATLTR